MATRTRTTGRTTRSRATAAGKATTTTRRRTGAKASAAGARTVKTRATSAREVKEPRTTGMTVQEAGRKGGLIGGRKGGQTVLRERGPQFYSEIGKKGGARVRELIQMAKALESGEAPPAPTATRRRRTTKSST